MTMLLSGMAGTCALDDAALSSTSEKRRLPVSEPIDRLCDQLRIKLHGIDRRLEALKANGSDMSDKSRHQLESQIDSVQQRIFDRRRAVESAAMDSWNTRSPAFSSSIRSPCIDCEVSSTRTQGQR